jgi:hypothetical protein
VNRLTNGNERSAKLMTSSQHIYEVRPRKDKHGVDLISDALPFGRLLYGDQTLSVMQSDMRSIYSRSHHAVIRVYDHVGNVIETHEQAGDFTEP